MAADVITTLGAALDGLCEAEPASLADGDTIVELHRQLERLTATVTRATAAFDAGREWEADGARGAAPWVAARCRLAREVARARVRLGRRLRAMPATEAAWVGGEIGEAQATALARLRASVGAECFDPAEVGLVKEAAGAGHGELRRRLAYWEQEVDPDGAEARAGRRRAGRRFHLSESFEGMWFGDLCLDPVGGSIVAAALRRIDEELFAADWAEARARVGEDVKATDLARTPAQRRADALVEMAERACAAPEGARRPEPLLSVFVGYETLAGRICELASGSVVTPGSLLPWLEEALVERAVFEGPDRVINVGWRRRLFSGATRRAVELRDRGCYHGCCDEPGDRCEVDHVVPWSQGGPTTEANGRLACGFHNRLRHPRPPVERPPP